MRISIQIPSYTMLCNAASYFCVKNAQIRVDGFKDNIQTSKDLQKTTCNQFVNVLCSNYSNGNVTGNHTDIVSDNQTGAMHTMQIS